MDCISLRDIKHYSILNNTRAYIILSLAVVILQSYLTKIFFFVFSQSNMMVKKTFLVSVFLLFSYAYLIKVSRYIDVQVYTLREFLRAFAYKIPIVLYALINNHNVCISSNLLQLSQIQLISQTVIDIVSVIKRFTPYGTIVLILNISATRGGCEVSAPLKLFIAPPPKKCNYY